MDRQRLGCRCRCQHGNQSEMVSSDEQAAVPWRLFLLLEGDGGDDDDGMGAGGTRSRCFRSADACPAWIQIDTHRYLPGGYLGFQAARGRSTPHVHGRMAGYLVQVQHLHSTAPHSTQQQNPARWLVPSFLPGPALGGWPPLALAQPASLLNPRCDREGVSLLSGDLSCFCRAAVSEGEGAEGQEDRERRERREGGP